MPSEGQIYGMAGKALSTLADITQRVQSLESQVGYSKVYGVQWDKSSNPVLTRTDDAVGLTANAGTGSNVVSNDFDKAQIYKEMIEVTDTAGNVFIRIPKCYIKKVDGTNFKSRQVCKTKYAGYYLPWCFWDFVNNKELDYVDVGKYPASLSAGNLLESKPNVYPLVSKTIVDIRTYAQANNTGGLKGYQQLDIHVTDLLQTLFTIEFATLNSQSIMQGWTAGQYAATHLATVAENNVNRIIVANANAALYAVGQPIGIGTSQGGNQICYGRAITSIDTYDASNKAISFDGAPVNIAIGNFLYNVGWKNGFGSSIVASSGSLASNADGKSPFKWRGIENLFGNIYQFVDGVNINEYQAWITKNATDYASNVFASPYQQLGYVDGNADGYAKSLGYDPNFPFCELSVDASGTSSTFYSDYYYRDVGQRIARFGGGWYIGTAAGLFSWPLSYASSTANIASGGRLVRKAG